MVPTQDNATEVFESSTEEQPFIKTTPQKPSTATQPGFTSTDSTTTNKLNYKSDKKPKTDTLLACLITLTRLYHKPFAPQTLTAGLPIEKYLTPDLFKQAAHRAGLSAKINQCDLNNFSNNLLPSVLLLNDGNACLLVKKSKNTAQVIQPEIGEGTIEMTIEQLEHIYSGTCIAIQQYYVHDKRVDETTASPKNWFWESIKKVSGLYSEVLLASFLINLFAIAAPLFIMNVYDRVVPNRAVETLWVLSIGMIIVISFDFLMRIIRCAFIERAGKKIDQQLSATAFAKILGLSMAQRPTSAGAFTNTVQSFETLKELFSSSSMTLLVDMPFISIFLLVIFALNAHLVVIPIVAITLITTASLLIQPSLEKLVNQTYQHAGERQAMLVESLVGAETIKILGIESIRQTKWEKASDMASKMNTKLKLLVNFGMSFAVSVQYLSIVALIITGVYLISAGSLTIGGLIACTILNGRALASIVQISTVMIRYKQSKTSFTAINKIMQLNEDRVPGKSYLNRPNLEHKIEFKEVTFTYPEQKNPILDTLSFKIEAGEKVGIIGCPGSGKSTLLKLMMNLYQPDTGQILVGNTDILQIDPSQLRSQISYLSQEVMLFYGSILDNITLATPYVEEGAIIKASEMSGLDIMVKEHSDGYDRMVNERGTNLSGGQRQIIALTRTLITNAQLYLFDEPTNSLDNASITRLIKQLQTNLKDKTVLLISHRPSVLKLADRIIVLQRGKIIADDSREVVFNRLGAK